MAVGGLVVPAVAFGQGQLSGGAHARYAGQGVGGVPEKVFGGAAGQGDQIRTAGVVGAHEGDFSGFAEGLGIQTEPLGVLEEGGYGALHGLAEDELHPFAVQALKGSRAVEVLAVFNGLDDLDVQAGGDGLLQVLHRTAAEGRRMDEQGHLGLAALEMVGHIFGQPDELFGVGGDGQEDVVGILQVAAMERCRDGGDLFFFEITFEPQGGSGRVVQVQGDPHIQKFFEVALGDVGFVLIILDYAVDGVLAEQFFIIDVFEKVLDTFGVRLSRIGSGTRHGQGHTQFDDLGLARQSGCRHQTKSGQSNQK